MRVIIIGGGIVGYTIAKKLSSENHDVVVIEQNDKCIKEFRDSLDVRIIKGSGSSPKVLIEAGIEKVDIVIAVTDSDEVNMIASLIAGSQTSVPKKIARIRDYEYANYTRIFEDDYLGLDLNINPEEAAAERIAKILEVPGAVDVENFFDDKLKLFAIKLSENCPLINLTPLELKQNYPKQEALFVALYRGDETIIPHRDTKFMPGDLLFTITKPENVKGLVKIISNKEYKKGSKVIVVGGGDVGFSLSKELESMGYVVKLIERNEKRCEYLAEKLTKTIVIQGDGTDRSILEEENISDMDAFISVTNDEEANILTALLAKQLGVERAISLIDKEEYINMVSEIGVDVTVSPRLESVSSILQFVRRGNILSVTELKDERVEAIETVAMETSDITDKPLSKVKFPKGVRIGPILRNNQIIFPTGDTVIYPQDKLVIFAIRESISKVEKMLMVKPDFF